jgi:hypothetical protein
MDIKCKCSSNYSKEKIEDAGGQVPSFLLQIHLSQPLSVVLRITVEYAVFWDRKNCLA